MSFSEMSLPTDIPWKRIGVSQHMVATETNVPDPWRSSVAVFSHEPPELPPEYCDRIITYLKITCTITSYFPPSNVSEMLDRERDSTSTGPVLTEISFPCYGAFLSVKILPKDANNLKIHDYPYISSIQPRKREMYEMVSRSGETLSQSDSSIGVSKGATNSENGELINSSENVKVEELYDMDLGGGGGGGKNIAGLFGWQTGQDSNKQEGTINRDTLRSGSTKSSGFSTQDQNILTTDSSRQKRESLSYSTNINQMYSLLQSYHLGTNRTIFYMQPRPHIIDTNMSFFQGARRLEGTQEFFLIVNRPKKIKKICIDTHLKTVHFGHEVKYVARVIPYSKLWENDNLDKTPEALNNPWSSQPSNQMNTAISGISYWNALSGSERIGYIHYALGNISTAEFRNDYIGSSPINGNIVDLITKFPNIGLEDAAVIFEKRYPLNGRFFVLGKSYQSCLNSQKENNNDLSMNVDKEHSSEEHIGKESNEPSILLEGKFASENNPSKDPAINFNNFIVEINRTVLSNLNSKHIIPYGTRTFAQSDYVLNKLKQNLRILEKSEVDNVSLSDVFTKLKLEGVDGQKLENFAKGKNSTELSRINSTEIANALEIEESKAREILSKSIIKSIDSMDFSTAKKPVPNPIVEDFNNKYSSDRLKRLINSSHLISQNPAEKKKKSWKSRFSF